MAANHPVDGPITSTVTTPLPAPSTPPGTRTPWRADIETRSPRRPWWLPRYRLLRVAASFALPMASTSSDLLIEDLPATSSRCAIS